MYAVFADLARSIKVLHINSVTQTIKNQNEIIFQGDVEILIDKHLHVWADRVTLYKDKQIVIAEGFSGRAVKLEDNSMLILAQRFEFNVAKKTGYASNIRFHVEEGYFSAGKAEKINETDWDMQHMVYTACDSAKPHWHIKADRAMVHGSYFVKASGLIFKVGQVPVFALPRLVVPLQGQSKSGFLMPRFAFDYQYGFGVKQNYYRYFTPHCDATIGIDWGDRKGTVFAGEFRWARSALDFTQMNAQFSIEGDRLIQRNDVVGNGTGQFYWIRGNDFRTFSGLNGDVDVNTLLRIDWGTDKLIGYYFFEGTNDIDNTFENTFLVRAFTANNLVTMQLDNAKTVTTVFTPLSEPQRSAFIPGFEQLSPEQKQSLSTIKGNEECLNLTQLPHLEWSTTFKTFKQLFYYRHDAFFDQMLYRQEELESYYANSVQVNQRASIPLHSAQIVRFNYKGALSNALWLGYNSISFRAEPTIQASTRLAQDFVVNDNVFEQKAFGKGAYRIFCEYGAEWALPEGNTHSKDFSYVHFIQPLLTWNIVPKFYQDNWFYLDKWDRAYPKNELACLIRNTWQFDNLQLNLDIKQAVDLYKQNAWFYLRRGVKQPHLLPFRFDFDLGYHDVLVGVIQEYEWGSFDLLQSELSTMIAVKRVNLGFSYLFQRRDLARNRRLLTDIPHFILAHIAIPLGKHATLGYEGQYYGAGRSSFFCLKGLTPLIHHVRLDYDGHCWGFFIGWEQKKFRNYGIGRDELSLFLAFRLNSLGSFAKKFKAVPQIIKNQERFVER